MIKFKIIIFLLFFLFFFSLSKQTFASVLFSDDFSNGLGKWSILSGQGIWQISNNNPGVPNGMFGGKIDGPSTIIDAVAGDENWKDYVFEFDMLPVSGADKNVSFRWNSQIPGRGFAFAFHFNDSGVDAWPPNFNNYIMQNGKIYHIKVIVEGMHQQFYVDNQKLFDFVASSAPSSFDHGSIGLTISTGSVYPSEVWFDNVKVSTIDSNTDLNVPLLKQTSVPWSTQLYDSANLWAPKNQTSISNWGCAITSATMIFQYFGITKLPDGKTLDPGSINSWLKSQPDGYVGNGFTNWVALSRLSKLAKSNNPNFGYDALQYSRSNSADTTQLTNDINNSRPDILEEPGHFIVGKGINGNTFDINDPYYDRSTLNDGYNNTFQSIGRFIPSHTDLSYIFATGKNNDHLNLLDSNNQNVGNEYIQQSLVNDNNPSQNNGPSVDEFYYPTPSTDDYKLHITSDNGGFYNVNIYTYDINGNVQIGNVEGVLPDSNSENIVLIHYAKNGVSATTKNVTFDSLINDIKLLRKSNLIKNDTTELTLLNIANTAKIANNFGRNNETKKALQSINTLLLHSGLPGITDQAKGVLEDDLSVLISAL